MARRTEAQTSVSDPAIPQVIVPYVGGSQFFVLNKDRSVLGASTYNGSVYALRCAPTGAFASQATAGTPLTFNERSRYLFEAGQTSVGGNVAVAVGAEYSGTNCTATNTVGFSGTNATLAVTDTAHQRSYVLSDTSGNGPDIITHFGLDGNYYSPGTLTKIAQAGLDTGGRYTSMVVDSLGNNGYVAVTQQRTDSSSGGLWIYDPTFGRTVKVLGPGGRALPAVGSFVLHNPQSIGGNLLVLVNQDNLSAATIGSPTPVTTPFTLIDLGQLGALMNQRPSDPTVTLPFVTNINSSLGYYAVFGAAYNPVDGGFYLLTGGGTSGTNILKQVVRYDPSNPASPSETPVADLAAVPLNFGDLPQIVLNGAGGTLQVLTRNPNAVYTVALAAGDTAQQVPGSLFGDGNFQPTYLAANALMGETYIASGSGQVDIIGLPSGKRRRGTLVLDGPNSAVTANQSTSVRLLAALPVVTSAELSGTVTITAMDSSGKSFTFATSPMSSSLDLPRYVSGKFPADDFYTVVATYPGSTNYPAITSPPVIVAVGKAPFTTTITATAAASSSAAATASVTLTGTTYAPTGTIAIKDASSGNTLKTYYLPGDSINNPILISFTYGSGTTAITASYSGDAQNSASTSASATITGAAAKSGTTLTLSAPTIATANISFNAVVSLGSANGTVPTGSVVLYATPNGSTASQVGSSSTTAAFGAGASIAASLPAGTYTLQAKYDGDANFNASTSNSVTLVVSAATAGTVTLSPTSLTFNQAVGSTSGYKDVAVVNNGGSQVTLSGISVSGTGFVQINGCGSTLAAGATCTIRLTFSPGSAGTTNGTLTVRSSAAGSPATVSLTGTGYNPLDIRASASSIADTVIGTSSTVRPTVTFTNNSGSNVTITNTATSNADFEPGPGCVGAVVAPGSSCTVLAIFHPVGPGTRDGTVSFFIGSTGLSVGFTGKALSAGQCTDTDGDALCDDWEKNGLWSHTTGQPDQFIDLAAMGADANHKDIFIQADWMQSAKGAAGEHSHKLKDAAQRALILNFASSPVTNPDGKTGINLHIDAGADSAVDLLGLNTWGNLSRAAKLDEQEVLDTASSKSKAAFDWTIFDKLSASFVQSGRGLVFHHAIMGHDFKKDDGTSGISRNGKLPNDFYKGASDFVVTMGHWTNQVGTVLEQGGTLMHELGHNLSLEHGGRDEDNYKPNYLSVMNYSTQTLGIIKDGKNGLLDYSRWNLPAMNEFKLNELTGIGADPKSFPATATSLSIDHYGLYFYCMGTDPTAVGPKGITNLNGNINFDCDAKNTFSKLVATDINGSGGGSTLAGNEDWSKLVYSGGAVGGNGVGVAPPSVTEFPEINQEENSLIVAPYNLALSGMNALRTVPGSQPTLRFLVANKGANDDVYNLSAKTRGGWAIAPGLPSTLAVPAGGTKEVTLSYTVPATAASGDGDLLTFSAVSQNAPLVADSIESSVYAESNPAPLAISVNSVALGAQTVGISSSGSAVVLVNTGATPLSFPAITASAEFGQTNTCPAQLSPLASCSITVTFQPAGTGLRTGTLSVTSSASATPVVLALQGTGNPVPRQRPAIALAVVGTGFAMQPVTFTVSTTAASGNTAPAGSVTLYNDSAVLGQITLDQSGKGTLTTAALGAGAYNLYASFPGDSNFVPVNTPYQALTLVDTYATITTLKASTTASVVGTPVTITATVANTSPTGTVGGNMTGTSPTGTVTFYEGTTSLGTGTLTNGTASLTTSTLAIGLHIVTASYGGDGANQPSTAAGVTVTVSAATVTLSASPASLTVARGSSGMLTITATPTGPYTGMLSFSCGTLPAHIGCNFSPATLAFSTSSNAQTTNLTITTMDGTVAGLDPTTLPGSGSRFGIVAAVFLPFGLVGFAARRRGRLSDAGLLLLLAGCFLATAGLSGCGGSSSTSNTSSPGTYSVQVTATANGVTSQMTVSVTVQ